jgi:hypothetical protein
MQDGGGRVDERCVKMGTEGRQVGATAVKGIHAVTPTSKTITPIPMS